MTYEKLKTSKTTVFEMETLIIIGKTMEERNLNFSKANNFLVKQADYLLNKLKLMKQEQKQNDINR